jgi:hypothetical protein
MEDRKRNEDIREEVGETNVDTGIKIRTWRPDATVSIPTRSPNTGDNRVVQG